MRRHGALVVRADALRVPLRDQSVDLALTSPPYFALRSYRDDGEHYAGQIGSEADPRDWLRAMWHVSDEMWRTLKPVGSWFVNIGEKYAGSGGHNNSNLGVGASKGSGSTLQGGKQFSHRPVAQERIVTRRNAPDRYQQGTDWADPKSLMGLPWAYALGMINPQWYREPFDPVPPGGHPRWRLRAEIIWSKPNGLPESVTDRVRRSHETILHFVKQASYYSAVDEVREAQIAPPNKTRKTPGERPDGFRLARATMDFQMDTPNPLGKLPGSIWTIPSEPLTIPEAVRVHYDLPDHFAAFPQEIPRRIILGWSPPGVCVACGEGRRPVCAVERWNGSNQAKAGNKPSGEWANDQVREDHDIRLGPSTSRTVIGYACACDVPTAPTRPAVTLDPFAGTGTVPMVARALGRHGVGIDLSHSYCRLAQWRIWQSGHAAKTEERTWRDGQGALI